VFICVKNRFRDEGLFYEAFNMLKTHRW